MTNNKTSDYQNLNEELDQILEHLQSSDLDIDKIISEYERGIEVITSLEDYLKNAKTKITKLSKQDLKSKK